MIKGFSELEFLEHVFDGGQGVKHRVVVSIGGSCPEVYLCVFDKIERLLQRHPNIDEITVIFFTDG